MQNLIRNTAIFYLMLLMLLKVLAVPLICLHYQLNKDYITANFCVNVDKPAMECNGKCHLRKQLARTADTTETSGTKLTVSTPIIDYCQSIPDYYFNSDFSAAKAYSTFQLTTIPEGFSGLVFRPPIVMCNTTLLLS